MKEDYEIAELKKQIKDLWASANRTNSNQDFQRIMDIIGEKRKEIAKLEGKI